MKRKNERVDESRVVSTIETPEDTKILTWLNDNSTWEFDRELFDELSSSVQGAYVAVTPRDRFMTLANAKHTGS